jgi:hypothetical protein
MIALQDGAFRFSRGEKGEPIIVAERLAGGAVTGGPGCSPNAGFHWHPDTFNVNPIKH